MNHPFVTLYHLETSVDQDFIQSVCWLLRPRPMVWLMPPQSAPWSTTLTSRGSTPTLGVPCCLSWVRVYKRPMWSWTDCSSSHARFCSRFWDPPQMHSLAKAKRAARNHVHCHRKMTHWSIPRVKMSSYYKNWQVKQYAKTTWSTTNH